VHSKMGFSLHYARRRRKKGCDWCVVKVVTSWRVDRTCDAHLHWHQYSLTSEFLKVPNIYLIEFSSST
jgi:allantoicase